MFSSKWFEQKPGKLLPSFSSKTGQKPGKKLGARLRISARAEFFFLPETRISEFFPSFSEFPSFRRLEMKRQRLTLEQVAKRAATRKNNQLRKKYPLFAEQWAVSVEQEIERIERQREHAEKWLENMRIRQEEKARKAKVLQMMAMQLLSPDKYQEELSVYQKFYREDDGYKSANFWFKALYGTLYAQAICPNKHLHERGEYGYVRDLKTMKLVKATECPACGFKTRDIASCQEVKNA